MPYLPTDRAKLQEQLESLVGEPLSDMYRAVGQAFEFGEQKAAKNKRGEDITQADLVLKFITADWRIVQAGKTIMGSSDFADGKWFYDSDQLQDEKDAAAALKIDTFLASISHLAFTVEAVDLDSFADISIQLSHDLHIQSFASTGQDGDLWWFHNRVLELSALVGPESTYYNANAD